jgi:hypothetical protein
MKPYYVVYDQSGQQVGHVSIADIERDRRRNPALRYEEARRTNEYLRGATVEVVRADERVQTELGL